MGKSTTGQLLVQKGIPVVDTDEFARSLVEPGQPALDEIVGVFGNGILDSHGRLRRQALANLVFADAEKRRTLESILHPRIRAKWLAVVAGWRSENHPLGAVIIPLLFEVRAEGEFDSAVCVACSSATQWKRLQSRGWDREAIELRLLAQMPLNSKLERSDYILWTEGSFGLHGAQLDRIIGHVGGG